MWPSARSRPGGRGWDAGAGHPGRPPPSTRSLPPGPLAARPTAPRPVAGLFLTDTSVPGSGAERESLRPCHPSGRPEGKGLAWGRLPGTPALAAPRGAHVAAPAGGTGAALSSRCTWWQAGPPILSPIIPHPLPGSRPHWAVVSRGVGGRDSDPALLSLRHSHVTGALLPLHDPPLPPGHTLGLQELCGAFSEVRWRYFWICVPGSSTRNNFQDPAECRLHDSDGSQAPAVWCPGDLQILLLLPVGVGKDAGAEPGSLADAHPWAAASEASSGVALAVTLSSIHTFGGCPSEVSPERWPKRSGVLVLRVWVTEGQLDWTPVFSLNTSSQPHSALLCRCHSALPVGSPRPRCFLRTQSGLCPGSLYGDGPHHLFLPVELALWGSQPGH